MNATGPAKTLGMGAFLEAARQALGSDASFTWVDEEFVLAHEVQPWSELPIWLPGEDASIHTASIKRAIAAGLTYRPLGDTIRATWEWIQAHPGQPPADGTLSAEKEAGILKEWRERP